MPKFIRRHQVITLYRDLLRATRDLEDAKQREETKVYIRREFEQWRDADEVILS